MPDKHQYLTQNIGITLKVQTGDTKYPQLLSLPILSTDDQQNIEAPTVSDSLALSPFITNT